MWSTLWLAQESAWCVAKKNWSKASLLEAKGLRKDDGEVMIQGGGSDGRLPSYGDDDVETVGLKALLEGKGLKAHRRYGDE
eukprot:9418733-Lingulodinium_polyedra.AAC.1